MITLLFLVAAILEKNERRTAWVSVAVALVFELGMAAFIVSVK